MAANVLTTFKQQINGLELEPSSGGCFELSVDGEKIYSKLDTGVFPDESKMVQLIGDRL